MDVLVNVPMYELVFGFWKCVYCGIMQKVTVQMCM